VEDGLIKTEEVYRFENRAEMRKGRLCWDTERLLENIILGLRKCGAAGKIPSTLGIDTWAVDFVLLDKNNRPLGEAVSYRDKRAEGMDKLVEEIIPYTELYQRTGIQKQLFNTLYQLMAVKQTQPTLLDNAASLLMLPDYFNFRLTGVKKQEYTNAVSTALVNALGRSWDFSIIERLGFPPGLFGPLSAPGAGVGNLSADMADAAGFTCAVVLPCTHDTGSAYLAVPAQGNDAVYLSSGTWSLMGVETEKPVINEKSREANFTNEGGYDYRFRFLKNIMGLWIIQSLRREFDTYSYADLEKLAVESKNFEARIDVNNPLLFAPPNMFAAIQRLCGEEGQPVPRTLGEALQCVYLSLARCYGETVNQIRDITGGEYTKIHIVGGGCKEAYLNSLIAEETGLPVLAGPVEGTAVGNLLAQMIAAGEFASREAARKAVKASFPVQAYQPKKRSLYE
jgi:rhamnulokinase